MKIGVLTFHRCINYGSYWQARCLVDGLRTMGHEAVLLDHACPRVDRAEWRCALRPTLPQRSSATDRRAYRRKVRRFFRAFAALPLSPAFKLEDARTLPECDAVVVGSDEVWNLSHPWYGGCALFYGEGIRDRTLVSYAASFGHHDVSQGLDRQWSERLRRFQRIAVRDEASRRAVHDATGRDPQLVLDPCLAFPPARRPQACAAGYLAVYGHGFSPAFIDATQRWARQRGLPVVSIGYRNDWADVQWLDAGPHEYATFIARAEAVATNFFHGCVFALRNDKPFVCEGSWYRAVKLRCLLAQVGDERRLLDAGATQADCDRLLDAPPGIAVKRCIERQREVSHRYLARALAA